MKQKPDDEAPLWCSHDHEGCHRYATTWNGTDDGVFCWDHGQHLRKCDDRADPSDLAHCADILLNERCIATKALTAVLDLISAIRAHYPESAFPPEGKSIDCRSAAMARHLCDLLTDDVGKLMRPPLSSDVRTPRSFEEAWDKKKRQGYQYGRDALEQVRFGWDIAMEESGVPQLRARISALEAEHEAAARVLSSMVDQDGPASLLDLCRRAELDLNAEHERALSAEQTPSRIE